MKDKIAIIGVGWIPSRPLSKDLSFREMIFEAAVKAYSDAGISPREVDTFVSTSEDFNEGVSIFDEYVPDQLGAVLKPVQTISGDALQGIASAYLQIATGAFKIGVLESHSKSSNISTPEHIEEFALDPIFFRNLKLNPHFLAGMDMRSYMERWGGTEEDVARVIVEARKNAMLNDISSYPGNFSIEDILSTEYVAEPLRSGMIQQCSDGAVVFVLASADVALSSEKKPVWIEGISFFTGEPSIDTWKFGSSTFTRLAGERAYKMAGISCPSKEISFAEIDDRYGYKFFVHLEELKICGEGQSISLFKNGYFSKNGHLPVNLSGGYHGLGEMHEATSGYQLAEAVLQLRGEGGRRQVMEAKTALVQSWRGLPTQSGTVIILSNKEGGR